MSRIVSNFDRPSRVKQTQRIRANEFGQWDRYYALMKSIHGGDMARELRKEIMDVAGWAKKRLKNHIERQDLNWTALAPYTIEKKGFNSIYYETGAFRRNLRIKKTFERIGQGLVMNVLVGPTEAQHPGSRPGYTYQMLAHDLEMGYINQEFGTAVPARPLFTPTWLELKNSRVWRRVTSGDELKRKWLWRFAK